MLVRIDYSDLDKLKYDFTLLKEESSFKSAGLLKYRQSVFSSRVNSYIQKRVLDKEKLYNILEQLDKDLLKNNSKLNKLPLYIRTIIDLFVFYEKEGECKKIVFFSSAGMHVPSLLITYDVINLLLERGINCMELSYPPHESNSKLFDSLLVKPEVVKSIKDLKTLNLQSPLPLACC